MDKLKTWLSEDFIEKNKKLVPLMNEENKVVSHCDAQENNVLLLKKNMVEIKLIDFEYAAFGPEEYDLANIFNELILDNNYAYYPYIRAYFENCASIDEVKWMIREYLALKYK